MARKSSPIIQISRKGLFIWIGLIVFISFWMFVLGVMVGRGMAPVNLDSGKLEKELTELKDQMQQEKQETTASPTSGQTENKPQLGFYEALKNPDKETAFKPVKPAKPLTPLPTLQPSRPTPKPAAEVSAPPVSEPKAITRRPVAPKSDSNPIPEKISTVGYFAIQIASVQDPKSAKKLETELRDKGYQAYHIRSEISGKGVWYRVRVGGFEDRGAAVKMLKKLKDDKYGGMVVSTK
jgi:DedD protein